MIHSQRSRPVGYPVGSVIWSNPHVLETGVRELAAQPLRVLQLEGDPSAAQQRAFDDAIRMYEKGIELSEDRATIAGLGRAYALAGRTDDALGVIGELQQLSKKSGTSNPTASC